MTREMDETTRLSLDRYRGACLRALDNEFGLLPENVTAHRFEDNQAKYRAWLYETLAWTCAELRKGNFREAFRGYAQAREYRGELGGFWPGAVISDCAMAVQNILENLIDPR